MKPLPAAATYIIGSTILNTFTGWDWIVTVGAILAVSALIRHIAGNSQA